MQKTFGYANAGGQIYRSSNGGSSWTLANAGAPNVDYNAIWIRSSAGSYEGRAVGKNGTVIGTQDGTTWTVQAAGLTASEITDLAAFDQGHACASYGDSSFLSFTSSGGWSVEPVTLAPIVSAALASSDSMVAVGGTRYIFAETGGTWAAAYSGQDTAWRLRYIVTRLDGYSDDVNPADGIPDDIEAMIDRACSAKSAGQFVLDEATDIDGSAMTPNYFLDAYDALLPIVGTGGITYDTTPTFLTHQSNVIGYTSWGMHDSDANAATTWARPFNTWANGGIATVCESTDGRAFDRPQYAWGIGPGGTTTANKLTITGFTTSSAYLHYRAVLHDSSDDELASAEFTGGQAQIDLSSVAWPADHTTYVQIQFPLTDPLHPNGVLCDTEVSRLRLQHRDTR